MRNVLYTVFAARDTAEMDCEAFEDGFVAAILTKAGQTAPVGAPVAVMAKKEADIAAVQVR
jgi:pyruvate dehydrogenase E2 component (dihydrolipoamide acetyltransferase)